MSPLYAAILPYAEMVASIDPALHGLSLAWTIFACLAMRFGPASTRWTWGLPSALLGAWAFWAAISGRHELFFVATMGACPLMLWASRVGHGDPMRRILLDEPYDSPRNTNSISSGS